MTTTSNLRQIRALGLSICMGLAAACATVPTDDVDDSDYGTDAQSPAVTGQADASVVADAYVAPSVTPYYDAGYVAPRPTPTPSPTPTTTPDAGSPTDQLASLFGSFANAIPGLFGAGTPVDAGADSGP